MLSAALEQAWRAGALTRPTLDTSALIDEASRLEGARPLPGEWKTGFELLARDLETHAGLNAFGRAIAHGQLVGLLRQRARATKLPTVARDDAVHRDPPVIILGHMRSGTTRLHRLLACDRGFSYTRLHETLRPLSSNRAGSVLSAAAVQTLLHLCNPQLRRIHPTSPLAPEEEFGLHAFSFHGSMFAAQWDVPDFAHWCDTRDLGPVYREFRWLLARLAAARGDPPGQTQLLKAPQFLDDLDQVIRTFPGACFLWMRRDLGEVVASSSSLVWNQRRIQSDRADPLRIGAQWTAKTKARERRGLDALARHPAVPVLTVDYSAVTLDWPREMRRVYDFLGRPLAPETLYRMGRVAGGSAHEGHRYAIAQFGIDPGELDLAHEG